MYINTTAEVFRPGNFYSVILRKLKKKKEDILILGKAHNFAFIAHYVMLLLHMDNAAEYQVQTRSPRDQSKTK